MPYQWIILVLVIGGRDYTTPSKAKYTLYISGIPYRDMCFFRNPHVPNGINGAGIFTYL